MRISQPCLVVSATGLRNTSTDAEVKALKLFDKGDKPYLICAAHLLKEPWTPDDLKRENVLVKERTSLKDIVLEIEDLFLANSDGDAFEEVFKLIYAKLYDEWQAARKPKGKQHLDCGGSAG